MAEPTTTPRIDLRAVRQDVGRVNDPELAGEGRRVVTGRVIYAASALADEVERLQAELAAARTCEPLGYTVAVNRPSSRDPERWEIVGTVHPEREPAENHQAYCQLSAEANPERYGSDVRYEVVEVRRSVVLLEIANSGAVSDG